MPNDSSFACRIDLHVHTCRYSPCAEGLDPEQLPRCLGRAGLQGLVLTEHDCLWPAEAIAALNRSLPWGRIYRGVEVSSCNGHFIVIGLERMVPFAPGISIAALLDHLRSSGAAVIWAHPYLHYGNTQAPLSADAMPYGIDALEVASSVTRGEQRRRALAEAGRRGWTAVGGSDAHTLGQVGSAYTLFAELPANEKALAAAIRQGRCRVVPQPIPGRATCC